MDVRGSRDSRKFENSKIKKELCPDKINEIDQISILYTKMDCYTNKINIFKQYLSYESTKPHVIILTESNAKTSNIRYSNLRCRLLDIIYF